MTTGSSCEKAFLWSTLLAISNIRIFILAPILLALLPCLIGFEVFVGKILDQPFSLSIWFYVLYFGVLLATLTRTIIEIICPPIIKEHPKELEYYETLNSLLNNLQALADREKEANVLAVSEGINSLIRKTRGNDQSKADNLSTDSMNPDRIAGVAELYDTAVDSVLNIRRTGRIEELIKDGKEKWIAANGDYPIERMILTTMFLLAFILIFLFTFIRPIVVLIE